MPNISGKVPEQHCSGTMPNDDAQKTRFVYHHLKPSGLILVFTV